MVAVLLNELFTFVPNVATVETITMSNKLSIMAYSVADAASSSNKNRLIAVIVPTF